MFDHGNHDDNSQHAATAQLALPRPPKREDFQAPLDRWKTAMIDPSSAAVHIMKPDVLAWGEGVLRLEERHTGATYSSDIRSRAALSVATTVGREFLFVELHVFERGRWALVNDAAVVAEGEWTPVGEDLLLRVPRDGMRPEFLVADGEIRAAMTPDGLAIRCSIAHLPVVSFKVDELQRTAWSCFQRTHPR